MPQASLPPLNIPPSTATVSVSIINTTGCLRGVRTRRFVEPSIPGHDWLATPIYSFLIRHRTLDRCLVFDLGMRKDWWNWPPPLAERLRSSGYTPVVPKDVRQILEDEGERGIVDEHGRRSVVDISKIEAVVWSHWHFDHTGDPSRFDKGTALIVGPGCKDKIFPGWPRNPKAAFNESDYDDGREVWELDFESGAIVGGDVRKQKVFKIGRFRAIDYFGDGSFYFLDSPGHAVGHICGLARVKSVSGGKSTGDEDSFVLMGGDAVHHGGELRPHAWHPLPESIMPHPFDALSRMACPGELFEEVLRDKEGGGKKDRETPIYSPQSDPAYGVVPHHDIPQMVDSIRKLQEADAYNNILVVAAHDASLMDIVEFFPKTADDFVEKGWVQKARWAFLMDFAKTVGFDGSLAGSGINEDGVNGHAEHIREERKKRLAQRVGDFSPLQKGDNGRWWKSKGKICPQSCQQIPPQ